MCLSMCLPVQVLIRQFVHLSARADRMEDAALILQMSAVPLSAVLNALARPVPGTAAFFWSGLVQYVIIDS